MIELRALQWGWMNALRQPDDALAVEAALMGWSGGCRRGVEAFAVHVNNIRASVLNAMRQSYPRTWSLVGDAVFSRAMVGMLTRSPPASGDLADYGGEFVDALKEQGASAAALDLARFEWCCDQVRRTPFQAPWSASDAAGVPQQRWPELVLCLRRDVMPVAFDHDVVQLASSVSETSADVSALNLHGDAHRYILVAGEYDPVAHPVSAQAYALASLLVDAHDFLTATEAAMRQFDDFEPFQALLSLVAIDALAVPAGRAVR
jgi:Putative DNA-binding domain